MVIQIPRDGLDVVLRGWSGDGQIFAALAAVTDPAMDISWSAHDIQRRAHRVLLGNLEATLQRWPTSARQWIDYLPVTSTSERVASRSIQGRVNWTETVRRFGWPPTQFAGRSRSRTADELALTTLAWTSQKLTAAMTDIRGLSPLLHSRLALAAEAAKRVTDETLVNVPAIRPDRLDLLSMASSGHPWTSVASVAEALVRAETDLGYLAYELIRPDPDLEWRLFHLAVLGHLLEALRRHGGRSRWAAPLSAAATGGPQFLITMRDGTTWDLWFEGAGANSHYRNTSLYRGAVKNITTAERSIGADILLVRPGERALLLECKWSPLGAYVGRDGFHQAAGYALEARAGLVPQAWSFVVGPEEIIPESSVSFEAWGSMSVLVGSASVRGLGAIIHAFIAGEPELLRSQ